MSVFRAMRLTTTFYSLLLGGLVTYLPGTTALADETADAAARWSAAGITNYSFTLTRRVMWGSTSIVLIEVRASKLVAANYIIKRTNPVPDHEVSDDSGLRKTIDNLLAGIASRDDFIRASFDPELGYPVNIYYRNADWDDAENQLEIRDFSVLTNTDPAT